MKLNPLKLSIGTMCYLLASTGFASDFNLPFINAADLGNLYSGWASSAHDASTAYTNPAGLIKIKNPELVMSVLGVMGSSKFSGTTTSLFAPPQSGSASTKLRGILPSFYYSVPLQKNLVFAFSANAPFALGTKYPKDSIVRYAATRSRVVVLDIGPSIGFAVDDKFSVGLGIDFNRMTFSLDQMYQSPPPFPDTEGHNDLTGWGVGWHGGVLYQMSPITSIGVSFNSMVTIHTSGESNIYSARGRMPFFDQRSNAALPARAQFSITHDLFPCVTVMGTVFYTNWSTFNHVTLQNTLLPTGILIPVTIPFEYHNTFDYSIGTNIKASEKWMFRAGAEYLNAPSNSHNRSVVDPIGAGTILGVGVHYQCNKRLGFDASYARGFFNDTQMNLRTPLYTLTGHSSQNTNVFGGQLTWDFV